jgi:hypothetical protein
MHQLAVDLTVALRRKELAFSIRLAMTLKSCKGYSRVSVPVE